MGKDNSRRRRGRRSGPSAFKRKRMAARAEEDAKASWYDVEYDYVIPNPDFFCPFCNVPMFAMPSPLLLLRCNQCSWQGTLNRTESDGSVISMDSEGKEVPRETLEDGSFLFRTTKGDFRMPDTTGKSVTLVSEAGGELAYSPDGHLIRATGDMAHFAVVATRPPVCGTCESRWTSWLPQNACREEMTAMAEQLEAPLYQIECAGSPWWWVHGFGGRVARCRACGAHEVLQTLPTGEPPTPDGEFTVVRSID